ncbi:ABC transporter substrate-binding protein [Paenibacillus motobuensis]|uniref:ABC transporter substrate-binding protein n=1 Tax=Paenibacillus TaxID=44249 RepID=UPI002041C0FA|nr:MULTISPECIES: ABC transporter substrate-binding protein [Paenibacillus]MCM3042583.1 ABC transporter substrate-binding protein [Paenibacillus lutimineralis]MCM3649687.1 ABC transporter substrate-binding protein [Paenibacillus motobuensis]
MRKSLTHKVSLLLILCLSFAMLLSACEGGGNGGKTANQPGDNQKNEGNQGKSPDNTNTNGNQGSDTQGSPLELALKGEYKGTKVTMFGPFVDADQVKFENSIKDFEEKTGIDIQYEGSKEFEATINIRVDGGNAPDIADFPQPGLLASIAKTGKVIDLNNILDINKLKSNYNQSWLDMATMPGKDGDIMTGVWNRSNVKSLVWYPKKQFEDAGYQIPQTWDELMALTEQIAKDGDAPWTIGIESGAATGWTATDWVEDIMLRTTTPENYDKWVKGELTFTSPEVKHAVELMSQIWMNKDYVYGGTKSIVTTAFGDATAPMFDNPPKAWLHRQANFITSFFPETAKIDEDVAWFYFPPIDEQYGKPVLVAGDIYSMFNDRPEVRAVMEFFTTGESIKTWVQSGGVIAPMNDASLDWYTTDSDRRMAKLVQEASTLRFDGSDLMPGSVGAGTFWKGMTDYVSGAASLDDALKQIQAGWDNK